MSLSAGACGVSSSTGTAHAPSGSTPAAAASWSAPVKVAGVKSLNAVSCPVAGRCVAVADKQAVVYADGAWSAPVTIESGHPQINAPPATAKLGPLLATVSCASPAFCVAGDDAGRMLTFDGTHWTRGKLVDPAGVADISCATASFCGAVDDPGDALIWNGSDWSAPRQLPGGPQLAAISCTTGSFCMAIDGAGNDAYTLQDGRWSDAGSGSAPANLAAHGGSEPETPIGVGCSAPSACAVVDNFGVAWAWMKGGWGAGYQFDTQLLDQANYVACPSSSFCIALDEIGVYSTWRGGLWSSGKAVEGGHPFPTGLSCSSARFCMAVDTAGRALRYG
ncbi:MAG: hypothetical protein ACLP8S_07780 [Solirubrobacteraceae bacterium]